MSIIPVQSITGQKVVDTSTRLSPTVKPQNIRGLTLSATAPRVRRRFWFTKKEAPIESAPTHNFSKPQHDAEMQRAFHRPWML